MNLPDFIGIGAQKSATTWLYSCLSAHPEICMSEQKEIRFFDNDARFEQGLTWYSRWFANCNTHQLKGEFSPTYLHEPHCPQRIWETCGDVKLIVCLRDPVQRLESHIRHGIRNGTFESNKLSEALAKRPEMIDKSKYYQAMCRYLEFFNKESIHIMLHESFQDQPRRAIQDLYEFLGADTDFIPPVLEKPVGRGYVPKSRQLETIKRALFRSLNRSKIGDRILNAGRVIGLGRLYRYANTENVVIDYDSMNRDELVEEFDDEYTRLPRLIGLNLDLWSKSH